MSHVSNTEAWNTWVIQYMLDISGYGQFGPQNLSEPPAPPRLLRCLPVCKGKVRPEVAGGCPFQHFLAKLLKNLWT